MEYRLDELFDLQMGKTPSRNNPEYWNSEDHKWISISDLSKCGKYILDTKEYISDKAVQESGISCIPANTVIMSFKLSIGKTAITKEPIYSNEAIMSFRDKHFVELLPDYIFYMDNENMYSLLRMFPHSNKIYPIYKYTPSIHEIEDPWYTGRYELVYSQIRQCIIDILNNI